MAFALDRATFRRLVWAYIAVGLLAVAAILPFYLPAQWEAFGVDFDALVEDRFGARDLPSWWGTVVLSVSGLILCWMIASTIGLFWFKRWARLGFWLSMIAMYALLFADGGMLPAYSTSVEAAFLTAVDALFGAIVLMSYASGAGAEWFGTVGNEKA